MINNNDTQTMYAIRDGSRDLRWDTKVEDGVSLLLPEGITLPVWRLVREAIVDLTKGGSVLPNPSTPMDWLYDFIGNAFGKGERDFVSWTTTAPCQVWNGCSGGFPMTRTYVVRLDASGDAAKSALTDDHDGPVLAIAGSEDIGRRGVQGAWDELPGIFASSQVITRQLFLRAHRNPRCASTAVEQAGVSCELL